MLSRRTMLAGAAIGGLLGARAWSEASADPEPGASPPGALKDAAPFPVGCAIATDQFGDADYMLQFTEQFSQITPAWEMKMGPMLGSDGRWHSAVADRLVAFARARRLAVHGTTLVWYKNPPVFFQRIAKDGPRFAKAYDGYIHDVTRHYRGEVRGWDVVNEPLEDDGTLRASLWAKVLGAEDHIKLAFAAAKRGDPDAVLFLNDYDLERYPAKRKAFLSLAEGLLRKGVPIGGLGTQCHLRVDQDPAALRESIADLGRLGLPVHISELDISTAAGKLDMRSDAKKLAIQGQLAATLAEAFMALPAKQRYAFTLWGMRDDDSWLVKPPMAGVRGGTELPLAFDSAGRPKPMAAALARAFARKQR